MKRFLMVGLLTTVFFLLHLVPGESTAEQGKRPMLSCLALLLQESGAQVTGYEIEGWAYLRQKEDLLQVLKNADFQVKATQFNWNAAGTACSCRWLLPDGSKISLGANLQTKKDSANLFIKVNIPGNSRNLSFQEDLIEDMLQGIARDWGLSQTVTAKIPTRLSEEQQLYWAQELIRFTGGSISSSLKTDKYLSITGYSPAFTGGVWDGKHKINLQLAIVSPSYRNETLVYLGSPLITCEY